MDQAQTLRQVTARYQGQLNFEGLEAQSLTIMTTQGALDLAQDLSIRLAQVYQKYYKPTLFIADRSELPRGIHNVRKFSLQQMVKEFIDVNDLNSWGIKGVIFYSGTTIDEVKKSLFDKNRKLLVFLGPKDRDTIEIAQRLRSVEKHFGIKKADIVSLGFESDKLSRAQFVELYESVNRFTPMNLTWRGSLKFHEKISDSIARWKFLVNLKSGYGSEPELYQLLVQIGLLPVQNAQNTLPRIEAR